MGNRGFTFIETVVIMGMVATLSGLVTLNVIASQHRASLTEAIDVFISDIHGQQTKAMTGARTVSGGSTPGYGVHVEADRYVLFAGDSYDPNDPSNASVLFPSPIRASAIGFPGANYIFASASGEALGYVAGTAFVTLTNTENGQVNTIRLNRYGVVTALQ